MANERFWQNALRWLDRGRQGVVGVDPYHTLTVLQKSGLNVEQTKFKAGLSVMFAPPGGTLTSGRCRSLCLKEEDWCSQDMPGPFSTQRFELPDRVPRPCDSKLAFSSAR
ncbi:hypothetical protein WMY93_034123 [Mugilogobius chulae]|uniref:Uncharacterized protein n=1 Tax=Mugilogobius chulae TaxID=88201 RepID=A0AAW0MLN3_9GOBI